MSYVTRADILAKIPAARLAEMLDDDGDGQEDTGLFDTLATRVSSDLDGILGQRYSTPLSPVPPIASYAATIFFLAGLFRRRMVAEDANPYAKAEVEMAAKLARIARGDEPLMPASGKEEAFLVSEDSPTHDDSGRISL